ncbi:MAG: hypothetical protein ACOYLF_13415 [Blastocatellia bacterium]|jgi:hypothetical protein
MPSSKKFLGAIVTMAVAMTLMVGIRVTTTGITFGENGVEAAPVTVATDATIKFFNGNNQEIGSWRPFPLDRVARGERFTVKVTANRYPVMIRVKADNGFRREVWAHESFTFSDRVPNDTSFDNATVTVFNHHGYRIEERRLPIGRK